MSNKIYNNMGLESEDGKLLLTKFKLEVENQLKSAETECQARCIGSLLYKIIGDMVSDTVIKLNK